MNQKKLSLYESLIPASVRDILSSDARSASDILWRIADQGLLVLNNFRRRKEAGELLDLYEGLVWQALGYYARKSAGRVKEIVRVGACYPQEVRERWPGLAWGYFERATALPPDHWESSLEFLDEYCKGGLGNPGASLPSVEEFIYLYQTQILGKQLGPDIPLPDESGIPVSAGYRLGYGFQEILQSIRRWRKVLFTLSDKPQAQSLLHKLEEIERIMPDVMREAGLVVPETLDTRDKEIV